MRVVHPLSRFAAMAIVVWMLWPAGAQAAFPGRNGLLAVQPREGTGIELVTAAGRVVRRLCGPESRCGEPVRPRWSPDGRELVFAGPSVRIVYADGSCLNCEFGNARNPAFEPDGMLISFAGRPPLRVDAIDGIRRPAPAVRGASDAVWSAGGALATVRGGEIWSGAADRQRRLGAGAEPSWAPGGRSLAAASDGWVVVYPGGRRLARGSNPAFSPDGRFVAYVAPGGRLMLVGARGGRPRRVGSVRAAAVDWQAIPPGPVEGCAVQPGSKVLASSPAAIVTGDNLDLPDDLDFDSLDGPAYMGCLRADGRERLLEHFTGENVDQAETAGSAVVTAPYAALIAHSFDEHYGGDSWTVQVFDLRTGALQPALGGETDGCDYGPCPFLDDLVLGADGVTAVHTQQSDAQGSLAVPLSRMSCAPDGTLCAAIDANGRVLASADPASGTPAWTTSAPNGGPPGVGARSIACPSATLCVGVNGSAVYTSTAPASDGPAWKTTGLPGAPRLDDVACASTSLCIAIGSSGQVAVSTDPAGGAWSLLDIDGTTPLDGLLCASSSACLVSDIDGKVFASSTPTGGTAAWKPSPSTPAFTGGSCAGPSYCVLLGGGVQASTDPLNGPWKSIGGTYGPQGISCPSSSLCVAVGYGGAVAVSTDPQAASWTQFTIDDGFSLTSVDCPSTTLCLATDANGSVLSSTDPTGGPSTWTRTPVEISPCTANSSCSVEQILANAGHGVQTLDSSEISGDGPFLTGLTLTGDTLTWSHDGSPRSATLIP